MNLELDIFHEFYIWAVILDTIETVLSNRICTVGNLSTLFADPVNSLRLA